MATLRKVISNLLLLAVFSFVFAPTAWAITVDQPVGTEINGWYKDSFTITVHYGNGSCTGAGTLNSVVYHSDPAEEGMHQYYFMSDGPTTDNPFYSIDGSQPQPLVSPLPCPNMTTMTGYVMGQQFSIALDAQAPVVSITSPSQNVSTTSSTYNISGTANDTGSGVQSLQLFDNGVAGTQIPGGMGTFNFTANLVSGTNSIQVKATDMVGHTSMSNPVAITYGTAGSGGGGSSGGSSTGNSSSSSNTSSSPTSAPVNRGVLKFVNGSLITVDNGNLDQPSNPSVVLAETGFPSVNGLLLALLIAIALLLIGGNALVIWRFRPVFSRLDRTNSGLRRRIIIIVTLPSLLPVFGIGFLAYQQLSSSLRAALSQELERAALTSSIKLEREFAMRQKVITTNGSDILQIESQYNGQFTQLAAQKSACYSLINSGRYRSLSSNDNCLPFLGVLAQVTNLSSSSKSQYEQALNEAYANTFSSMQADEQQRTNALLSAVRAYFPDTTELALINTASPANILAVLPAAGKDHPVTLDHKTLLAKATSTSTTIFDSSHTPAEVLFTYPITDVKGKLQGNMVAAFNVEYTAFVPAIWQATPKPYAQDDVFFLSSSGQQIYPIHGPTITTAQAKQLANTSAGSLITLTVNHEALATRVSQVNGTGWDVAVGAPPASILAPVANIQRVALLAIISFLLLSLLLGIIFVGGVATEIEALYQGAIRFAKGELDYKIALPSHDELKSLGDTMNQMATDIKTAQAALIEKDKEFINITSHELKAPMTAILGNLSMIMDDGMGSVDTTARQLIEQAFKGTQHLKALVTDLLDVARLDSGKAQFNITAVDIANLIQNIVTMQSTPAHQAKVSITYQPATSLPPLSADDSKLQIIVTNFISNAIKYNRPNGTVTITHELKDGLLQTNIADTGLGIPDDQKDHIFEKYYRVQHADRVNVPGTGLGMYITKRFIEAMGGTVWFDSVHGQGTTFHFTLPISHTTAQQASSSTSPVGTQSVSVSS